MATYVYIPNPEIRVKAENKNDAAWKIADILPDHFPPEDTELCLEYTWGKIKDNY